MPVAHKLRVPLIVTLHGYDVTMTDAALAQSREGRRYLKRRERLKKASARFLCVSNFIHDRVIADGFPADKTLVHYTGVDVEFFKPEPSIERSPVVLFVGRLVPKKGCEYLIRSMSEVQTLLPAARLIVVGDGPLRGQLELQAKRLLRNFEFVGAQQPVAVKKWMNRATVFCGPSVTAESGDAETFGTVFAEAQAMGLPVVSFVHGGIPEAVSHGKTGLLVAEKDWRALADSILLLFREPQLWSRFSEAGRKRVKELFDVRKQGSTLERIYDGVLNETSPVAIGSPSQPGTVRNRSQKEAQIV